MSEDPYEKYKLKVDEKRPYHYMIGVGVHPMSSSKRGQVFMKYGPIFYTNEDVEKLQSTVILKNDKMYPGGITEKEAIEISGASKELMGSIRGLLICAEVNNCTVHHFSSDCKFEEEDLEAIVNAANISSSSMDFLMEAKIGRKY